jgi:hypothetical protein
VWHAKEQNQSSAVGALLDRQSKKENSMRMGIYAFAAVAIIAATLPAAAQDIRLRAGENGVGVKVGNDNDGRRDGWREGRRDHCRTIVVKHRTPDGDMVIRRTRRCD